MAPRLPTLVARIAGPPFVVAALAPFLGLAFVVTQTIGIIDWPSIAARTSSWGPLASAGLATVAVGLWARTFGAPLANATQAPALAFARRAPLGDVAWATALAPLWALSGAPLLLLGWFVRGPAWPIEPFALLATWPLVASVATRPRTLAGALGGLFVAVAVARLVWPLWFLLVLAAPAFAVMAARQTRVGPRGGTAPSRSPRPRSAFGALLRHDLLAIVRLDPRVLPGLLVPVPLVLLAGARLADSPAVATPVVLALSSPSFVAPLGRLVERLGTRLDPGAWPVRVGVRVLALWCVVAGSAAPASAAALASAPNASDAARMLALVAALASGAVWLATGTRGGVRRLELGGFTLWALAATVAAWVPFPRGFAADLGFAVAGVALARRALARQRGRP